MKMVDKGRAALVLALFLALCGRMDAMAQEAPAAYQLGGQAEDFKIDYGDDTKICGLNGLIESDRVMQAEESSAAPIFTITFTDEAGTPISGVMAQICDDTSCTVLAADENGVVTFEGQDHSYELHVLMAPAGYAAPMDVITLSKNGGEIAVVLASSAQ